MKVAVLGGYGVFGSRLARLLRRDGCEVWVAGRDADAARRLAEEIGASALELDISRDLTPLLHASPDIVIDAAGPFQDFGDNPYRVAHFCVRHKIHYVDLSDDAAFTAGISGLDRDAKQAGVFVLSGVSSVPALSSSVVAELSRGLTSISAIETAILPGANARMGKSVMRAILGQVGGKVNFRRAGRESMEYLWSDPRSYDLGHGIRRKAWLMSVPDILLFPDFFQAASVTFRAGLELWIFNFGLTLVGWLRRMGLRNAWQVFLKPALLSAAVLSRFGSDRGGMIVRVIGRTDNERIERCWTLLAEAGEGPFIPTVAARAVVRTAGDISPGARACLAELRLDTLEGAFQDLAVKSSRTTTYPVSLFESALADDWAMLPLTLQRLHTVTDLNRFTGRASVRNGKGIIAGMLASLFRFPPAGEGIPLTVTIEARPEGEVWERNFAGRRFRSKLLPVGPSRVRERFGPLSFELHLPVRDGRIQFDVLNGRCLGVPVPSCLLPKSEAWEYEQDGKFHFDVSLFAPLGLGLIVRYQGWLIPDRDSKAD